MRPQHLIVFPLFQLGSSYVPSLNNNGFVNRKSVKISNSMSTLRMDIEGDAIDTRTRRNLERKLFRKQLSQPIAGGSLLSTPIRPLDIDMEEAEHQHGMPWTETIGRSVHDEPLLYMPFWKWQMEFMKSNLSGLRAESCGVVGEDTDFGFMENKEKKARIVSHCYSSDEYRKIRMTYYDAGDNTQVFNSVWYPDPSYNLPILGIDLLSFNRKRYLAIVDFQPIHAEESDHAAKYEDLLCPIKDEYDSLKGRMSSKFYDETQFFSKQMLFARFEDGEVVPRDLMPAYQRYVATHLNLVKNTIPDHTVTGRSKVVERQTAYDSYSADRDPATGLFAAMFGKKWAEDYVHDFLFSLSERKEGWEPTVMGGPPQRPTKKGANSNMPQRRSSDRLSVESRRN